MNTHKINKKVFAVCSCFSALFACDQHEWREYQSVASTSQSSTYQEKGKGKGKSKAKKKQGNVIASASAATAAATAASASFSYLEADGPEQSFASLRGSGLIDQSNLELLELFFDYSVPKEMPEAVDPGEQEMHEALSALYEHIRIHDIFRGEPGEVDSLKALLPDWIEGAVPPSKRVKYINQLLALIKSKRYRMEAGVQLILAKIKLRCQWMSNPIEEEVPAVIDFKLIQKTVRKGLWYTESPFLCREFEKLPPILDKIKEEGTFDETANQLFILLAYSCCKTTYTPQRFLYLPSEVATRHFNRETLKIAVKKLEAEASIIWGDLEAKLFADDTDGKEQLRKRFEKDKKTTSQFYLARIDPTHRERFLQLFRELTPDDYVKNPHIFSIFD